MEFTDSLLLKIALGVLIPVAFAIHKLRGGIIPLRIKRTERLYSLLRSGTWRTAHAGTLQLAVDQAFGQLLDDREIHNAFERHSPLNVLRDSLSAKPLKDPNERCGRVAAFFSTADDKCH